MAVGLNNPANLLRVKGQYREAERFQFQAIDIERGALSPEDPILLETLYGLGAIQAAASRYADAEATFRHALAPEGRHA
jgi:hypothetical protein